MVDEVKIKITADASEAKQAFRDIHFYEKALQEDTELLKDLQVEYKEALADTGGKLTGKALELHKSILDIKASMAKSEREIEKSSKGELKNLQKIFKVSKKFYAGNLSRLLAIGGTTAAATGGVLIAKNIAEAIGRVAQETYSQNLSAISTGMSASNFSSLRAGGAIAGASSGNLGNILTNLNDGILALKTGIGDMSKVVSLQNRTGISLTDEKGNFKTQEKLLSDIQEWVKTQPEDKALYLLKDLGFTPDVIQAMKNGGISSNNQYKITEKEQERLDAVAREMRRVEESAKKRNVLLSSFFAPVSEGFHMLHADINDLIIKGLSEEEKKEDNRTPEEKEIAERRNWAVKEIVQAEDSARFERQAAKDAWFDWSRERHIKNAEAYEDRAASYKYALMSGDLDSFTALGNNSIYNTEKQKDYAKKYKDLMKNRQRGKENKSSDFEFLYYNEKGQRLGYVESLDKFIVLDSNVVPEKASSSTGDNGFGVVNNYNINNENSITTPPADNPQQAGEMTGRAINAITTAEIIQ